MSVDIEPAELSFQRPFTVEVSRILTIKNPSSSPIAFKVKTTAPKQYCVRPNAGRIEPGQDFDVSVLLQAMKSEPPADAKCRDKFLVQSATITPDKEFAQIATVLDGTEKGLLQERKIRVIWLAAKGDTDGAADAPHAVHATPNKASLLNGATDTPEASRTYSSPNAGGHSPSPPPYEPALKEEPTEEKVDVKSTVSAAATTVSNTAQATYEELKNQLAQAQAQIVTLKDSGLRQRSAKSIAEDVKKAAPELAQSVKQTVEGVPVQIVALLCLVSFLLAYFFF